MIFALGGCGGLYETDLGLLAGFGFAKPEPVELQIVICLFVCNYIGSDTGQGFWPT